MTDFDGLTNETNVNSLTYDACVCTFMGMDGLNSVVLVTNDGLGRFYDRDGH